LHLLLFLIYGIIEQNSISFLIYSFLYFITFAGFPPTIAYAGTSFVTTDPAAMIDPLPILLQDGKIIENAPNQTSSSIIIIRGNSIPCNAIGFCTSLNL